MLIICAEDPDQKSGNILPNEQTPRLLLLIHLKIYQADQQNDEDNFFATISYVDVLMTWHYCIYILFA